MAGFPVRHDDRRPWRYRLVSGAFRGGVRSFLGSHLHMDGLDTVPAEGPLIVAANHLSNLDPILMGALFPRTLHAMAKAELFSSSAVGWMLSGCNVFSVDRGAADRHALTTALRILDGGGRLLIFVEGTRAPRPGMVRAEAGVGFLQRRSGAAVLPVAFSGTERVWPRGSARLYRADVHLTVGSPFTPQTSARGRAADQDRADEAGRAIAALLPPRYRGVYAEP